MSEEILDGFVVESKGEFYTVAVSPEDYKRVMEAGPWWVVKRESRFYVMRHTRDGENKRRSQFLHRLLMDPPDTMQVDHRDGNGLNCCRSNMRVVTNAENSQNTLRRSNSKTSRYRGVCWNASERKWQSAVMVNQKAVYLGRFDTELDAALAAQEARNRYFTHNVEDRHPVMEAVQ